MLTGAPPHVPSPTHPTPHPVPAVSRETSSATARGANPPQPPIFFGFSVSHWVGTPRVFFDPHVMRSDRASFFVPSHKEAGGGVLARGAVRTRCKCSAVLPALESEQLRQAVLSQDWRERRCQALLVCAFQRFPVLSSALWCASPRQGRAGGAEQAGLGRQGCRLVLSHFKLLSHFELVLGFSKSGQYVGDPPDAPRTRRFHRRVKKKAVKKRERKKLTLVTACRYTAVKMSNALRHKFEVVACTRDWHPADHCSFADMHGAEVFSTKTIPLPDGSTIDQVIALRLHGRAGGLESRMQSSGPLCVSDGHAFCVESSGYGGMVGDHV